MNNHLGRYFTLQRGTTYKSSMLGGPGPVLLGLGSITRNGGFKDDNLKTYSGYCDPRMLLSPGDMYVSLKDVTQSADLLGAIARVPTHIPQGRLTQDTVRLVPTRDLILPDYIYWLLRTPEYREYCRSHSTGTTNLGLSRDDFLAFNVPELTPLRKAITTGLQRLEDKIELNRRMNETLEAMAQEIFRDWFVDFGPVRRKMEGATDPVVIMGGVTTDEQRAAELAALFPASFSSEELPDGWELLPLQDSIVLQRGFDLPKTARTHGPYPVIAASGPHGTNSEYKVRAPGVCTGRSGVLGNVFLVQQDFWPLNTSLWIKEYKRSTPTYAYHLLLGLDLQSYNAGSAVPTLNRNHVHEVKVVTPTNRVVAGFDDIASRLYRLVDHRISENRSLAETRDYLLPRLMSGEVRVSSPDEITSQMVAA